MAAIAAAMHLAGVSGGAAAHALESFVPVAGRGARRRIAVAGGAALLLDESYNGNPASMRAALAVPPNIRFWRPMSLPLLIASLPAAL